MNNQSSSLDVLRSISDATSELVKKIAPSIVSVNTRMTRGTGIILTDEGHILTCSHVLGNASQVRVGQKEKIFDATPMGLDPYSDVAVLKTDQKHLSPAELGDSDELSTGQFVIALANPFNRQPSATSGIITSVGVTLRGWRSTSMENVIATDARLNPGFSGGPLVDVGGKVIGLNAAYVWSRGIAIPINRVKNIVNRLMMGGRMKRAFLGIISNTVQLPQEIISQIGLEQDTGVMVYQVESGTPAKKAGLTMGDVIIGFNNIPVTNFYDLPKLLTEDAINKKTQITILRGEKTQEITITPTTAEEKTND